MPDRPVPSPPPSHPCPGGCGSLVLNRYFACGRCWHRLPHAHQRAITGNTIGSTAHTEAMLAARRWFGAGLQEASS